MRLKSRFAWACWFSSASVSAWSVNSVIGSKSRKANVPKSAVSQWAADSLNFLSTDLHGEDAIRDPRNINHHANAIQRYSEQDEPAGDGVDTYLMSMLCCSQLVLLGLATVLALVTTKGHLLLGIHWCADCRNGLRLPLTVGAMASIPIILGGQKIYASSSHGSNCMRFTTSNFVITLFGRRRCTSRTTETLASSTKDVLLSSVGLVFSTAIAEEVVFRGYLLTGLTDLSGSLVLALLGQAILYGVAHLHPHGRREENLSLAGLQASNGLWYGFVYAATGNLVACMLSHLLYDWHNLASTWHTVNNQMDWSEEMTAVGAEDDDMNMFADRLSGDTRVYLRRFFYAFDSERKKSLSLLDVEKAIDYAFLQDYYTPEPQIIHSLFKEAAGSNDRLDLPSFVHVLFRLRNISQNSNRGA